MNEPFAATHTIPDGGLEIWAQPDPAEPSITRLEPGVPVAAGERRGEWVHIVCDNGFAGWLGATTLQPVAATLVGAAPPAAIVAGMPAAGYYASLYETAERGPTGSPATLALAAGATVEAKPANITAIGVGVALTIIGCFLPWFSILDAGITGYEIPLQFLLLKDSMAAGPAAEFATNGPTIGLACLLAALAGLACSRRAGADKFRRLLGWLIVLLPTMTVGQVQLLLRDDSVIGGGAGGPGLLSTLGIGLIVTMIGGLVLALSPRAVQGLDATEATAGSAP